MQIEAAGAASPGTPTETVSAERAASDKGDVGAFMQASRERRTGKPPAAVERPKRTDQQTTTPDTAAGASGRPAVPGREGQAAKGPTDKDREADERLTARIRDAVETSTAELRRKNQELEARLGSASPAATDPKRGTGAAAEETSTRKALTSADLRRYQAMPDAPKLDEKDAAGNFLYESAQEHAIAMADFIREQRDEERASSARQSGDRVARLRHEAERVTTFAGRIEAYKQAHPDRLVDNGQGQKIALSLSPEVAGLHGYAKLAEINHGRQQQGLAPLEATVNHAIAEEIYDSDRPAEVLQFLSEHPEEFQTLRGCQTPQQLTKAVGRLEQKLAGSTPAPHAGGSPAGGGAIPSKETAADARRKAEEAVDRSVSSAKPLSGNLGRAGSAESDPEEAAIAKGDFGAFQAVQRTRRLEKFQGARR